VISFGALSCTMPVSDAGRLAGKVVIVTGAGQGIGRAFCHSFAREGASVVVTDVVADRADAVAAELRVSGGRAVGLAVDVTDVDDTLAMADVAVSTFGAIDVLINNAAIFTTLTRGPFESITKEQWDAVMAVNVRGVFLSCQAVAPQMRARSSGSIISISAGMVKHGRANYAHYVTSKAALIGLTRTLATELGNDGITVNTIMPGATQTEVPRDSLNSRQIETLLARQAIHRWGTTDDIVGAALFLASDDARFITGQSIIVDGGHDFQ